MNQAALDTLLLEKVLKGRASLGVCGPEEYCVWKLLHERIPDSHREGGQVSVDVGDPDGGMGLRTRFPGRG
jgi:hypothetical protein